GPHGALVAGQRDHRHLRAARRLLRTPLTRTGSARFRDRPRRLSRPVKGGRGVGMTRRMHLAAYVQGVGAAQGAWRSPRTDAAAAMSYPHWVEIARIAEA